MAPRTRPTVRQQRLGAELRRMRERYGLSVTQAASLTGTDQAQMSGIELGRVPVGAERLRSFASSYGCLDDQLVDSLANMTGDRGRKWWNEYRGVLPVWMSDIAEMEHHARGLCSMNVVYVPGLLQTRDYARAVFEQNDPSHSPPQVEHRLDHRMKRQDVVYRDSPVPYTAIIHEAALRMRFGGAEVARRQARHLLDAGERESVTVRVIPFTSESVLGSGQSVMFAEGPVPQLDTVQVDTEHGCLFVDAEAALDKYRTYLKRMESAALGEAQSRELIATVLKSR